MHTTEAFKLAYAVAKAVRPERKQPKGRFARLWARKRLAEDEVARHNLATECAKAIQMVACPEEWHPEAVARRTLDQVLRALWATGVKGIQDHIRLSRATVLIDQLPAPQRGFVVNVGIGGETVRLQTVFVSYGEAEAAAENWISKIGAVSTYAIGLGKARSVERVEAPDGGPVRPGDEAVFSDIVGPPDIVPGDDLAEAKAAQEKADQEFHRAGGGGQECST